uniref:Uncharacterized protein n=1 Tax=Romanomermis culicivorax TaxID=13658 RepID=A0A915KGP7_ROMCU
MIKDGNWVPNIHRKVKRKKQTPSSTKASMVRPPSNKKIKRQMPVTAKAKPLTESPTPRTIINKDFRRHCLSENKTMSIKKLVAKENEPKTIKM